MNSVSVIQRLHHHRAWVNQNLLTTAGRLSEQQLQRKFEIGQGTVWKTLVHMYGAEYVWIEALLGNENPTVPGDLPGQIPGNQLGDGGITSLADLNSKWGATEYKWKTYLQSLAPESLEELVYKIRTSGGDTIRLATRRVDILLHVCTHAQYTAAQAVNMLRHLGVKELPETMLISLARQELAQGS